MASWTTPTIFATGNILDVASANVWSNNETFLYQSPYALYYNSSATSIPNGTVTQVTLGGTTASGYGFSVSTSNVIVPLAGIYSVSFSAQTVNTSGGVVAVLQHNGSTYVYGSTVVGSSTFAGGQSVGACIVKCSASDTLGLYAFQGSVSSANTGATAQTNYIHAFFVGSQ